VCMAAKFIMALVLFLMINNNIGYMHVVSSIPVAVILAMICCLLPANGTVWIAGLVVLLDMYALSMEAALVTFVLFAIIYFIYFRFAPTDGIAAVLTPIAFRFHIPYLMPVAAGLLRPVYSIVSVICGSVLFYFFDGIHQNASTLKDVTAESESSTSKINVIVQQLTGNKEMFLTIVIFVLAFLIVSMVRRMSVDHAWTVAIAAGALFELVGLFAGYLILNISGKMIGLVLGSIVSALIGYGIRFFFMDLDYARTERVQFQDDEYFYSVKAVPKKMVASKEKTVKHFGTTGNMGKKIDRSKTNTSVPNEEVSRKVMAQELDIDEDLLK
jgi:uncharacterized protein (DUF697 family)